MRNPRARLAAVLASAVFATSACDRGVEPYVPGEQPSQPDLRKIFPPGAAQAEKTAGAPQADRGEPPPPPGETATAGEPIRGSVSVAPALAARMPAGAVLFIVARRGASGPPVAVKRVDSPQLPLAFEIGPDDRMIAAVPFSGPLLLSARLDGDGNATTRTAGDLQGAAAAPVDPGAHDVEIVLGEVL